ncbi:MAG: hypothetical protein HYV26_02500 [Candidatus Hydrogenedentes bacterium]|nr:hypothetical protein [Candidatus Hydrogenedentota bacterium]MBI3118730.1 hypothetical protein [Candidatus Hydrogenedentota bacterium]
MRHLKPVCIAKAMSTPVEKQDVAGLIFLQIWLTFVTLILTKGLSD